MALINLLDVGLGFGGPPVLEGVNFQIDPGERVCVVGRNGSGKSCLLQIVAGAMKPDRGEIARQPGARFARLSQSVPDGIAGTVHEVVYGGVHPDDHHEEDWERDIRLERLLEALGLPAEQPFDQLSGGMKRRALLARALAAQPDLLLLDEPTNHLDIESIERLEQFLLGAGVSLLFVTHDRAFLRKLSTRIVEIDRGRLSSWSCDYETYLVRKQEVLEAEDKQRAAADKKLAQEEEWIRRGVKAQRSRAGARIQALMKMRAERRARREVVGEATMKLGEAGRSGMKVIDLADVFFAHPGAAPVVAGLTTTIMRGDKVGIVGPNGSGKTTLIKLLLGQLVPTRGTVAHGTNLEVVYLDQLRAQIADDKTVADNIADGATSVTIDGRQRHVISYLQDFLFSPDRSRTPARVLSGGERNRLLLARLFTKPANVLVLDEPTNDLDIETLDLLEDLIVEFSGTVLLVSHDREFLDEVVTSVLVLEGEGKVGEYVGGYSDYLDAKRKAEAQARAARAAAVEAAARPAAAASSAPRGRKLNNRERRELEELPSCIEKLETEQAALSAKLADPAFYGAAAAEVPAVRARLQAIETEIAETFTRWESLEAVRLASEGEETK
ncbi:ATP-binding cassette domain-containing protein [Opitutales bacterium ASA1]|uniref:ATP-binding cassette domain-containing protein n=1 Tax=Congregicoccus parvus TaxID=3081749 RepID=UPI002B299094|nr:ATP-binding cassette domain-containing protein [Opitutales bacterium ASA1]